MSIGTKQISEWNKIWSQSNIRGCISDAVARHGIIDTSIDQIALQNHQMVYSNVLPLEAKATSQKKSGR